MCRFEVSGVTFWCIVTDTDIDTNVYIAGDSIPKVKTERYLGALLGTVGTNDMDFTEGRIVSVRRCICGFMSLGCRATPITPCQELECIAPCP